MGRFLYAADGFDFLAVSAFAISRTTGALKEVPGSPFPAVLMAATLHAKFQDLRQNQLGDFCTSGL